jgi:hypothetical protein
MYAEQWSREEIEECCNNHNLLLSKANTLRSRVIFDLYSKAISSIISKLRHPTKGFA